MYQPRQFRIEERAALHEIIDGFPFATLITQVAGGGFSADHLPLLLEPDTSAHTLGTLRGHIARANPLTGGPATIDALAIFHGPQAYVTPSWYPAKREHGKVVPTWNYQVVHAHGRLRLIDDADWLRAVVGALTERFEGDRDDPWSIDDAPPAYIETMCRAIVGIELTIERLEGKRKASQHKSLEERAAILRGLQEEYGYTAQDAICLSGTDVN